MMLNLCPKWIPWAVGKVADDIFRFPMSPVLRRVVASAPASLPTEGKGSGAVQSLFPWFCLCFQRAFKSFDDVWRLWEVRRVKLGTPKVDCTPPVCGEKLQVFLPPFLPGFGWCSVTWSLIRLSTLLPPCWRTRERLSIKCEARPSMGQLAPRRPQLLPPSRALCRCSLPFPGLPLL